MGFYRLFSIRGTVGIKHIGRIGSRREAAVDTFVGLEFMVEAEYCLASLHKRHQGLGHK